MRSAGGASLIQCLSRLGHAAASEQEFIDGCAAAISQTVSERTGTTVECVVSLRYPKRPLLNGCSTPLAGAFVLVDQELGVGPCTESFKHGEPVIEGDFQTATRWPGLQQVGQETGYQSILCVPLTLTEAANGVFSFFSTSAGLSGAASAGAIGEVLAECSDVLRLAVKLQASQHHAQDLTTAMEHRSVIDSACGVLMAQNRCSHEEAFDLLREASNNRNQKLHTLALDILHSLPGETLTTHFYP